MWWDSSLVTGPQAGKRLRGFANNRVPSRSLRRDRISDILFIIFLRRHVQYHKFYVELLRVYPHQRRQFFLTRLRTLQTQPSPTLEAPNPTGLVTLTALVDGSEGGDQTHHRIRRYVVADIPLRALK